MKRKTEVQPEESSVHFTLIKHENMFKLTGAQALG